MPHRSPMTHPAALLTLCALALAACDSGRVAGSASWSGAVEASDGAWSLHIDSADLGVTLSTRTPLPVTATATPTLAPTASPTATRTATPTVTASPTTAAAGVSKVAGSPVAGSPYAAGFRIVGGSLAFGRGSAVAGAGYEHFDARQGTVSLWLTPEWTGSDGQRHELLRWSAAGGIWKAADGRLYASFAPTATLSVDVAGWQAGARRRVEVRWDSANPIDAAGNHAAISVDDAHTYGVTGAWVPEQPEPMIYVGSDASGAHHVAGHINGLVVSRSVWWDGSAGTDTYWGEDVVGMTGSKTSGAPYGGLSAPRMGVWDVAAALPTNRVLGLATSGTVDGWSMPHVANLLAGGFNAPADGATWALSGLTPGADYVIRAVGWSDGQSIPRLTVWDATAGAEIAHLDGLATSTRRQPDNLLYAFELPTTARGAPANTTAIEVRLQAAGSGAVTWGQVELYPNQVDNPSFATGTGDPFIPHGWTNFGPATAGEVVLDTTAACHTPPCIGIEAPASNHHGIIAMSGAGPGQYTWRAWGGWMRHAGTESRLCYQRMQTDRDWRESSGSPSYPVHTMPGGHDAWEHHGMAMLRKSAADSVGMRFQVFNGAQGCAAMRSDDVYVFALPSLAITVGQ